MLRRSSGSPPGSGESPEDVGPAGQRSADDERTDAYLYGGAEGERIGTATDETEPRSGPEAASIRIDGRRGCDGTDTCGDRQAACFVRRTTTWNGNGPLVYNRAATTIGVYVRIRA